MKKGVQKKMENENVINEITESEEVESQAQNSELEVIGKEKPFQERWICLLFLFL